MQYHSHYTVFGSNSASSNVTAACNAKSGYAEMKLFIDSRHDEEC